MRRFVVIGVLVLAVALFGWALAREPSTVSPLVGGAAPAFAVPLFDRDSTLALAHLAGRPVVLNFWASWCLACREEAAVLEAGWRRHGSDVAFIGVAINDEPAASREFIARYGKTYWLGPDGDGSMAVDYGLFGVPETFFIDRRGRVVAKHTGPLSAAQLEARVAELVVR
ncbi:MAG: TlpA family protein disulfide reductase [Gemmatimonadota bacterium]